MPGRPSSFPGDYLPGEGGPLAERVRDLVQARLGRRPEGRFDAHRARADGVVSARFRKRMHVSPFEPMDQTYEISVTAPGKKLGVVIRNLETGREVLVASMALHRFEMSPGRMLRLLLRYPPMTVAVLARIYANALRLKLRGAPFHPHPEGRTAQSPPEGPPPLAASHAAARRRLAGIPERIGFQIGR